MADDMEFVSCWQCSDFSNIFPEFMCTINKLKMKKQRTDEDSIIEKMITTGNSDITSKDTMNNIFDFSVGMGYLNKSSYNDHFTYKISSKMDTCETCKVCGEKLLPFDCENYEVDHIVKYVDVQTFEALAAEIKILKDFVAGRILNETEEQSCPSSRETITNEHTAVIHKLEENVKRLADELKDKEKIIEILFKNLSEHFKSSRNSNVLIRKKSGGTKFEVNLKSNINLNTNRIPSIYEVMTCMMATGIRFAIKEHSNELNNNKSNNNLTLITTISLYQYKTGSMSLVQAITGNKLIIITMQIIISMVIII